MGRDDVIEHTLDVLAKRHSSCPCLIGAAGVGVEHSAKLPDVVAAGRHTGHLGAGVAHRGGQHHRVGLVDLAGLQGYAGRHQFRTGRDDQHTRSWHHPDPLDAEGGQQSQGGRAERGPGAQHRRPGGHVLSGPSDVLTGPGR